MAFLPFLLALGAAAPASASSSSDLLPCLNALASVWAPEAADSYAGGTLPRVVRYEPPHHNLTVWKRRDGQILALDGKNIFEIPALEGKPNGHTFSLNLESTKRELVPSVYRKIALEDGRTFELHRVGEEGRQRVVLRGDAEDEAALKAEAEEPEQQAAAYAGKLAEHLARLEQACERSETRFIDQTFVEQLSDFLERRLNPRPGAHAEPDRMESVRAEENIIAGDLDGLREAREKKKQVEAWERAFAPMKAEREKTANRLKASAVSYDEARAKSLLQESAEDFSKRIQLARLSPAERETLGACKGYLELPEPAAKEPAPSLVPKNLPGAKILTPIGK